METEITQDHDFTTDLHRLALIGNGIRKLGVWNCRRDIFHSAITPDTKVIRIDGRVIIFIRKSADKCDGNPVISGIMVHKDDVIPDMERTDFVSFFNHEDQFDHLDNISIFENGIDPLKPDNTMPPIQSFARIEYRYPKPRISIPFITRKPPTLSSFLQNPEKFKRTIYSPVWLGTVNALMSVKKTDTLAFYEAMVKNALGIEFGYLKYVFNDTSRWMDM